MMRTLLAFLWILTSVLGYARGTQEKDFQEVQGKGNFTQSVDLTKKAPGEYNLLVRTKDAAGNVSYAGPYNFYYDPTSDNPLMTVANPSPGMRLGGSFHAVGVASAPKGVALVEVQLDDGPWGPALGKEFWSAQVETSTLKDGLHRLSVRGTDVNGVVGPVVTVPFHLDQALPVFTLASVSSGQRVHGEVSLSGSLSDGNGLESLTLSTDNRKSEVPLGLQGDGQAVSRSFQTTLDTRKFSDGPLVLWFHGTDGQHSEVRQPVLVYVDNKLPVVTVLSPPAKKGLHGRVRFAVQAEASLGLKSLTAQVGDRGEILDIPVVPGNPFHAVDLDLPSEGSGTVAVVFRATDPAGKVGTVTYTAQLDGGTDLPVVTLASDWTKGPVKAPVRLVGTLGATDGPGGLGWSLNGAPEVVQPVGAAFDFSLPGVRSGANTVVLVPIDAKGKRGKPLSIPFNAVLGPPSAIWQSVVQGDQEVPFLPGAAVRPDKRPRLKGRLTLPNPVKSVVWSAGSLAPLPVSLAGKMGDQDFVLVFPDDPPFGVVPVILKATDIYGQESVTTTFVNVANLSRPQGPEGMAFADARVGQKTLVVTPESPLVGFFSGGKIRSADLVSTQSPVPPATLMASHDDHLVTLKALKDGRFNGVTLRVVSDKGRVYDTDLGTLVSDTSPPVISLSSPSNGAWVRENLRVDGQAADNNGIALLEWSIDDGRHWQALDPPAGLGGPFSRQLSLPGPDSAVNLLIRATDGAGRTATFLTVVRRDTQPPVAEVSLPADSKAGTVYAVVRLRDEGALQKAEITVNGKTASVAMDHPFVVPLEAPGGAFSLHVLDWAGNILDQSYQVRADGTDAAPAAAPSPPAIQIVFPSPETKGLSGVYPVVGRVTGFAEAPQLSVKGEAAGEKALTLTDAGYFTLDVDVSNLKSRSLAFVATGTGKQTASLGYTLPSDPASGLPSARFSVQGDKPILVGNVSVSGWIGDSRGAVSWITQFDGGEKRPVNPGPNPVGTFLVDLGSPSVGPHKFTLVPVNGQGREGAPVTTEFVSTRPSGPVTFTSFDLGASLAVTKDTRLQGTIPSVNSWRKVEVRFADLTQPDPWNGPFQPLPVSKGADGIWGFSLPFPADLPYSRIGVMVRGEDSLGQAVEGRTLFHRIWPKDSALVQDAEGLTFVDDRLDPSGKFSTSPGTALVGTFRGRPIKQAVLVPTVPGLELSVDGSTLAVSAKSEGLYGPFTVAVTTIDNEKFSSQPLTVFADLGGPTLDWTVPKTADFIRDKVELAGTASDPSGLATVEVSVDGGTTWTAQGTKDGTFSVVLPVAGADGLVRVVVRATDKGGHISWDSRALIKDGSAPVWTLVAPPADRKVNGKTTLIATAADLNPIVSVEYSDDNKTFHTADGTDTFTFDLDYASYKKLPDSFWIRTTDASGNQAVTPLVVPLDQDADKPVVQIQSPADGEVVRSDFVLSGMAFDDDGVQSVSWRVDGGDWQKLDGVDSFQIPFSLASFTDNEHLVEVQAQDIYGTKGNLFRSVFKVSLAPPDALLQSPTLDSTVSGIVGLVGASFDRNGIQGVQVSLDNGLTWNQAELRSKETFLASQPPALAKGFSPAQRAEWEWRFDSRTLKDGTYLVMIRTRDGYGTAGLFTTLVNIDNTPPTLTLTSPKDGTPLLDTADLEGRSADNIKLVSLTAELRPIASATSGLPAVTGTAALTTSLAVGPTFNEHWNLGSLAPGWYNLRLEARDAAGNAAYVARNIRVEGASADRVELLFPQSGETLHGTFLLEGKVTSRTPVDKVVVVLDGNEAVVVATDSLGAFSAELDSGLLSSGEHTLQASARLGSILVSEPTKVVFSAEGPWVRVTSHKTGSFVTQRPFILGTAGWTGPKPAAGATADELRRYQQLVESHRVTRVEVSLDNGKSFSPASGTEEWKFRLETLGLADGPLPLLFRAWFQDGSAAIQRILVVVDQTPPQVSLLTNLENGRFNGSVQVSGFTDGAGESGAVEIAVRQGDKAGYEVPQFIQGMYLDTHLLGATLWESGLGLTFFQEAVKIQAQLGQTPEFGTDGSTNRFWGTVVGAKLVASIAQLPMSYVLGPDWSWLSTSLGVGANFSEFSMGQGFLDFGSGNAVMLGGVVIQWEVAKALLRDLTFFKSYSWYNEATVWFISSDVQASAVWTFSTGLRVGLF